MRTSSKFALLVCGTTIGFFPGHGSAGSQPGLGIVQYDLASPDVAWCLQEGQAGQAGLTNDEAAALCGGLARELSRKLGAAYNEAAVKEVAKILIDVFLVHGKRGTPVYEYVQSVLFSADRQKIQDLIAGDIVSAGIEGVGKAVAKNIVNFLVAELFPDRSPYVDVLFDALVDEGERLISGFSGGPAAAVVAIADGLWDRGQQFYEMYQVTNELTETQERAFAEIVASTVGLAILETSGIDNTQSEYLAAHFETSKELVGGLYGSDDQEAIAELLDLTRQAIIADLQGDTVLASQLTNQLVSTAKLSANIYPWSLLTKPEDWFSAVGSFGADAPERAMQIILGTTNLSKYVE